MTYDLSIQPDCVGHSGLLRLTFTPAAPARAESAAISGFGGGHGLGLGWCRIMKMGTAGSVRPEFSFTCTVSAGAQGRDEMRFSIVM